MSVETNFPLEIRKMVKEDVDEVAHLMTEIFSKRETISVHFRRNFNETEEELFENYAKPETARTAKEPFSFVCVDKCQPKSNQIIGFILCRRMDLGKTEDLVHEGFQVQKAFEELSNYYNEKYLKLYPETKVSDHLTGVALGIKDGYERKSIATNMFNSAITNAKNNGFQYIFAMTTIKGHEIFLKKLGMELLFSIPYEDIEYKGVKYLKAITDPPAIYGYNLALNDSNKFN